ncbi:MAG: 4Fe-4S binding protein [Elusimicrobiota bacterium]
MIASVLGLALSPKHLVFAGLAGAGQVLCLLGRGRRLGRGVLLLAGFVLLGGIAGLIAPSLSGPLGMHPSPMCSLNKLIAFAWIKGRFALPLGVGLGVILLLSLLFRKSFCGWACPLGALQELLHAVPVPAKLKPFRFRITNGIRAGFMAAFFIGLAGFGVITYDSFNGFEALHWGFELGATAVLAVIALASLFYFRPYCYLVCPIGLVTWVLEPLALSGVKKDGRLCDGCGACLPDAPCPSLEGIVAGKSPWIADCVSCGWCLDACPKGALKTGVLWMERP